MSESVGMPSGAGQAQRDLVDVATDLNLAQRFDRLPLTRHQHVLFLIIATAWLVDSADLAMITFVLAPISEEFGLGAAGAGAVASSGFAGMLLGASTAGVLADRFGRRVVFQYSMVLWGAASLLMAFSWDFWSLIFFRFLIGCGMGAEFPVAQSLVSEFIPSRHRGRYIAWLEGFWPLGFVLAGVLSLIIVPTIGWRWVFVALAVMSAWLLVVRRIVPESPRWLESRGRRSEAAEVMAAMERDVAAASGKPLAEPEPARHAALASEGFPLRHMFTREYRKRTFMAWAMWFFVLLGYYSISTWMGKLLADSGMAIADSIAFVLLMTLWGIPGFLSAAYLVDRLGRKPVLCGYIVLSAVAAYFYGGSESIAGLIVAGSFMQFFFFGMWSALYAYTPEVFPTRARATGCGTASAWGRAGALVGPSLVPVVLSTLGTTWVFYLGAVVFLAGAAVVLLFGPETKQKVLEEVST